MSHPGKGRRIVEALLLLCHRGEGLLLRLHHLKQELEDSTSDLAFLQNDKVFAGLGKSLGSVKSGLANFNPGSKVLDDLVKMKPKIVKHLLTPLETLIDAKTFIDAAIDVFHDCNELLLDASRVADLTKLYLDLVVFFNSVLILVSRIESRRLICVAMYHSGSIKALTELSQSDYKSLCQLVCELSHKPLLASYELLKPFKSTLKNAFLSSTCLAFTRQRSSSDQWRAEDFLSFQSLIPSPSSSTDEKVMPQGLLGSCLGFPFGVETIDLERMERWFFFGFLHCHSVVDLGQRDSGEVRLWNMLLQGMWTLPIFRDQVLLVHEELGHFFKALKGSKAEHGQGTSKKAQEMKSLQATSMRSASAYHYLRRLYLTSLLRHYHSLLSEQPALLGPKYLHVNKLLTLCKYELCWLLRHQANAPTKKQTDQGTQQGLRALQKDFDVLSLVSTIQDIRDLWRQHKDSKHVLGYFRECLACFYLPHLQEVLGEEVAKINDANLDHNPMQICLKSCEAAFNSMMDEVLDEDGFKVIRPERLTESALRAIKLDLLRLEAFLVLAPSGPRSNPSEASRPKRAPSTSLTRLVDATLCHIDIILAILSEDTDVISHDPLVRNAYGNVSLEVSSNLSILPLAYPQLMKAYFNMTFHSSCLDSVSSMAFVQLFGHVHQGLGVHQMSPDDGDKSAGLCQDQACLYLKYICNQLFTDFRKWVDYHVTISKSLLPSNEESAFKFSLRMASKKAKSAGLDGRGDSFKEMERLIKSKKATASSQTDPKTATFRVDQIFQRMTQLCQAISKPKCISVAKVSLRPKELFVQALKNDFASFVTPRLTLANFPSLIEAAIEDYIWCTKSLVSHFSQDLDLTSLCFHLLTKLRSQEQSVQYLRDFFDNVLVAMVDTNLLVFSETFQTFVLPHCLRPASVANDGCLGPMRLRAETLQRFISQAELQSMARIFGPDGTLFLLQECLIKEALVKELRGLRLVLQNKAGAAGVQVSSVLRHGIKVGSFLALRNLIIDALSDVGDTKMPFLSESLSAMMSLGPEHPDHAAMAGVVLGKYHYHDHSIASALQGEGLTQQEVSQLITILARVIPQAARFTSSMFVSEAAVEGVGSRVCIDGHFNNLNTVALTIAHLLSAMACATCDDVDDPEEQQKAMLESFLTQLASNMLDIINTTKANDRNKRGNKNVESVTLLLSLIVDHSPLLTWELLERVMPVSVSLLHRARNNLVLPSGKAGDGGKSSRSERGGVKRFKLLTMDSKSLENDPQSATLLLSTP